MKPESFLTEYSKPDGIQIGYFESTLSPDGWEETRYNHEPTETLRPYELGEFIDLVTSFFRDFKTQTELKKFCKKHGTPVDSVTTGFRFNCAMMDYTVLVTGYSAKFAPYRKENV